MPRVPLHFLPAFVAVTESGSVRAAAKTLHLTHGAVSLQLSELESRLGFPLFDRRAGKLVLNDGGRVLLESARRALADIDDGVRRAGELARRGAATLRLTMPVAFAQRWFLPRLERWMARHPQVPIDVDASPQVRDLRRDPFDAAIRSIPEVPPGTRRTPLHAGPQRLVAVAAPALAQRLHAGAPEALLRERLLGHANEWSHWFEAAGVAGTCHPVEAFNSLTLRLNAAEKGLGVGLAAELLVGDAIVAGTLVPLFGVAVTRPDLAPHGVLQLDTSRDAAPLADLCAWLMEEADASLRALDGRMHAHHRTAAIGESRSSSTG